MPWTVGAAAALAGFFFAPLQILSAPWKDFMLDKAIDACAIFVAYLTTAATIIPAIEEKAIVRKLKSWGYFTFIVNYFRGAAIASGVALIFSLALIPLAGWLVAIPLSDKILSSIWWGVFAFAVASVYRATRLVIKMIVAH